MSTQEEVQVSYDISNDFFALWLDSKMNYTCGLFDDADNLEQAQRNKLEWLANAAEVKAGSAVLDIGCGWGACIDYLINDCGVSNATGITLSPEQCSYAIARRLPGADFFCTDYRDYQPEQLFDALISICMMEHIATPLQVREGEHINLYRDYFRRAHEWSRPGAHFGLQTILRTRMPRNRDDLLDIGWVTQKIFPGGISLRLEDIAMSVNPYWEILEIKTRRTDYEKTTTEWKNRLRSNREQIETKWGKQLFEDYDRYLSVCIRAFSENYQSLAQYKLRRID